MFIKIKIFLRIIILILYNLYIENWKRIRIFLCLLILLYLYILINKYRFHKPPLNKLEPSCIELTKNSTMFNNFQLFYKSSHTLCNERATKHGLHQKVIAISAYQSNRDNIQLYHKIWSYTLQYISEAKQFYPDWRVRVYYHNLNITNDEILHIEKYYKNVDFCDAFNIPILGNLSSFMSGRFHRFVVLADPFVDIYMSRDIDSPILEREIISVNQWLLSNKLFHIMRDHPLHYANILAGLWAFKISINSTIRNKIIERLFTKSIVSCYNPMVGDQDFLKDYIWPLAEKESIQHDSFNCIKYPLSIPFSKPKLSMTQFVGCRRPCRHDQDPPGPCPIQCISSNNTNQYLC